MKADQVIRLMERGYRVKVLSFISLKDSPTISASDFFPYGVNFNIYLFCFLGHVWRACMGVCMPIFYYYHLLGKKGNFCHLSKI